jgi:hypothetical protein
MPQLQEKENPLLRREAYLCVLCPTQATLHLE